MLIVACVLRLRFRFAFPLARFLLSNNHSPPLFRNYWDSIDLPALSHCVYGAMAAIGAGSPPGGEGQLVVAVLRRLMDACEAGYGGSVCGNTTANLFFAVRILSELAGGGHRDICQQWYGLVWTCPCITCLDHRVWLLRFCFPPK